MELYDYQKDALRQLLYHNKHFIIAKPGLGKTAIAMNWVKGVCEKTGKRDVLVVTTASKARTTDFQDECDLWNGKEFRQGLRDFTVISWNKFRKWQLDHAFDAQFYVVVFDECQRAGGGTSSGMGKAFLNITSKTTDWVGFTATPGDTWLKFYPYFVATGLSRNKTSFLKEYATIQTYKGYPEIVEWRHEATLKAMWEKISYAPDTEQVMAELPAETHKVLTFKKPTAYAKTLKTRTDADGNFLDTCFPADTPVATESGIKKICDIQIGENVWSYDTENDRLELMPVINTLKHKIAGRIILLTLSNRESIISTDDHKHYVNGSYIRADEISEGDYLYVASSLRNMWKNSKNTKDGRKQDKEIQKEREGFLLKEVHKSVCVTNKQGKRARISGAKERNDSKMWKLWEEHRGCISEDSTEGATEKKRESILLLRVRNGCKKTQGGRKRCKKKSGKVREISRMFNMQCSNRCNENRGRQTSELRESRQNILQQQMCKRVCGRGDEEPVARTEQAIQPSEARNRLRERIFNLFRTKNERLSDSLQSGYSSAISKDSNRVRRAGPQKFSCYCKRQEERKEIRRVRVESITVLEPRDIRRRELYRDPDNVYCIEVDGNHNFFANGILTHNCGALCSELRRLCFTKDKQQWVADFTEGLGTGAVMFFNFTKTGDLMEQILTKTLKGVGKVWRIDGKHHDIPTADTIGERDVVLCQWQSGSEALNLQFLHYWVSIEPHYSYSTSVQARGRIKRLGQEHKMFYYYLLTDYTIEQDIMKCLKGKSDFSEDVWTAGKGGE